MKRIDITNLSNEAIRNHYLTDETHFLGINSDRLYVLCWEVIDYTGDINGLLGAMNDMAGRKGARKMIRECIATICEHALCELTATDWAYDDLEPEDRDFLKAAEELLAGIFHFAEKMDTGWAPIPTYTRISA